MGAEHSRIVADADSYNRNFSAEHKISAWEGTPPKNADYYNGDRSFVVGKDMYRCYQSGYLWGHYDTEDPGSQEAENEEAKQKILLEIEAIKKRVALLSDPELEL